MPDIIAGVEYISHADDLIALAITELEAGPVSWSDLWDWARDDLLRTMSATDAAINAERITDDAWTALCADSTIVESAGWLVLR